MKTPDFKLAKQGDGSLSLYIYDEIGPSWAGMIDGKLVSDAMKDATESTPVNVFINSPGGSVFEGIAIYNLLARHKGDVTVHIDGAAFSAASLIAMAGDTIKMAENAMMMIHNPWAIGIGNASEMRSLAALLDKIGGSLATSYVARTGKSTDEIVKMLNDETWFDAKEAVEQKFADEVVPSKTPQALAVVKFVPKNMPQRLAASVRVEPQEWSREEWFKANPVSNEADKASTPSDDSDLSMQWKRLRQMKAAV